MFNLCVLQLVELIKIEISMLYLFLAKKLSLVYDQFAFYVSESRPIYLFIWFMPHLLNKSVHSPSNSTFSWPPTSQKIFSFLSYFSESNIAELKGEEFICVGWIHFLAVMGRLAAGKDLTFKVQNTRANKLTFSQNSVFISELIEFNKGHSKSAKYFFHKD